MNRSIGTGVLPANQPRVYKPIAPANRERWQAENNIVRHFALWATLAMLFVKFSSIHEFTQAITGVGLPIMYVLMPPAALGMLACGGLQRTMKSKLGWWWAAFTGWLILALPFSSWFGGSVNGFYMFARTELLMLFLVAGTLITWADCRKVFMCAGLSLLVPVIFALRVGNSNERLTFSFDGSITNPNYLAAHVLLLLPFSLYIILRPKTAFVLRIAALAGGALGVYAILRTASRGAMIALVFGALLFLWRSPARQRIIAALVAPLVIAGSLYFIPSETLRRLMSFSSEEGSTVEAMQSAESRKYLFRKSVEFTIKNPIFGVGLGQFSLVEGMTSRASGDQGNWHETHNAYTQISSENGVPPLLFFLAAMFGTIALFHKLCKRARAVGHVEIALAANCALISTVAFSVAIIFLSLAYTFYLPTLSGLAIAMYAAADRELNLFATQRRMVSSPMPLAGAQRGRV